METNKSSSLLKKLARSQYINLTGIIVLIITFGAIVTIVNPLFLSKANILNLGRQMVVFGIIACALAFPQIAGNTDMGIESVGALCGAITCELVSANNPGIIPFQTHPILAILIGVVVGALCGALNGVLIAYTTIPAFIVTLGTQTALRGMTYIVTSNMPISSLDERFLWLSSTKIFGVNIQIYLLACFFLVTAFILNKTTFG
ncbi:MAG: ABC transporter permease, partial [Oscillospiraceae bacterium]|nr:ABC transporter permease [Oscillospiraceae bacterium]